MRKRDWDRSKDPEKMIQALGWWHSQPTHNRRLRIFTLTAGRAAVERYGDTACQKAVSLIWRMVEGTSTVKEMTGIKEMLHSTWQESLAHSYMEQARIVNILELLLSDEENCPISAARHLIIPLQLVSSQPPIPVLTIPEWQNCCGLLREFFGDRGHLLSEHPLWQSAWLTPTVQSIAASIYQDRAFDRLPVLADALEEAGCTNADLLLHCRKPGEHVRGCWVVDLVLGKQ